MPRFGRIEMIYRRALWDESGRKLKLYRLGRGLVRRVSAPFRKRPLGWVANLYRARWLDGTSLELDGWAFERGTGRDDVTPVTALVLRNGRKELSFPAEHHYHPFANVGARLAEFDYANYGFRVRLDLAGLAGEPGRWQVCVRVDTAGKSSSGPFTKRTPNGSAVWLDANADGTVSPAWAGGDGLTLVVSAVAPERELPAVPSAAADDAEAFVVAAKLAASGETLLLIEDVELASTPEPHLLVSGRVVGPAVEPELAFTGKRAELPVRVELAGGRFRLRVPLLARAWNGPELPPPLGGYQLESRTDSVRVLALPSFVARTPFGQLGTQLRLRYGVGPEGGLQVRLRSPLPDGLLGDYKQIQVKKANHAAEFKPLEAIYFESFSERVVTDSPYALDREAARVLPDIPRYWGVYDYSIPVPEGSIPVLKGSDEWWELRARCRYVVINEWIRQKFQHRPHQMVLQTWHGSMFKRIGRDRPNFDYASRRWLDLEKAKWDVLLSQNPHSTAIFRSAYAWDKPIWEEGYPRNDILVNGSGAAVRESLGIEPGKRVVLYCPTWRDDTEGQLVDFLDLRALAAELGDEYVFLLRGHSRTLRDSADVRVDGVLDVTSYPHVSELFLAADAMITDYSSVMFDYSVTGRPMIFFTPDLDRYRDQTRGVYFDLEEVAPGPVVSTQKDVLAAIDGLDASREAYAGRYRDWRAKFNPHDDGHVSERVVSRLFELPLR
jgi:CDP-glycerol glycerophosphotransferase (TagB/SpsB family)